MNTKVLWPKLTSIALLILILSVLFGNGGRLAASTPTATPTLLPGGLTENEVATLGSLEKVDDFPLYTMHYFGSYDQSAAPLEPAVSNTPASWACSLFAAFGDAQDPLYGRNFDWIYSPAVLLSTDPPSGYASVSMVDIAYLGFTGDRAFKLLDLPLEERRALLDAPFLPFDGMNVYGLVVGMAAVAPGEMKPDPNKPTVGSLEIMRKILDHARTVDEAVILLQSYNIDMAGGPPLHYLIADPSGRADLVEFYQGEMVVIPNEKRWHLATNFLRSSVSGSPTGQCSRYDKIDQTLTETQGELTSQDAADLLASVSQLVTQWSVVYHMRTGQITVTMGRQYTQPPHIFHLTLK